MTAPFDLAIDSGGDEFAVAGVTPRLSFKTPVAVEWFELEAVVGGEPLGSVRVSSGHPWLAWPWRTLRSSERVAWRVRGDGDWSDWHRFEVGLLDEDWRAHWISPVEHSVDGSAARPAHTLAVHFDLADGIRSARLYATALGLYEAFVNGQRAGSAVLSPGASSSGSETWPTAWPRAWSSAP